VFFVFFVLMIVALLMRDVPGHRWLRR